MMVGPRPVIQINLLSSPLLLVEQISSPLLLVEQISSPRLPGEASGRVDDYEAAAADEAASSVDLTKPVL